jgi:hypothetical protein
LGFGSGGKNTAKGSGLKDILACFLFIVSFILCNFEQTWEPKGYQPANPPKTAERLPEAVEIERKNK